jgi:Flp pilus assembly protein TadD
MEPISSPTLVRARHYLEIRQPQRALEALAQPTGVEFELEEFWFLRGQALLDLDRNQEAAEAARGGLARNPDSVGLLYILSSAEAELGNLAAAEEALLAALRIVPDLPELLGRYAVLVARAGQFEKAERLLQRAAALDPESPDVARSRTLCAYLRGDDKAMARESQEYLARSPDDRYAHYLLGRALLEQNQVGAASRHLSTAARLDPSDSSLVEDARGTRWRTHPLLWPMRPLMRLGTIQVWLGFIVCFFALRALGLEQAALILALVYIVLCLYSWIVPPLLRWWLQRR